MTDSNGNGRFTASLMGHVMELKASLGRVETRLEQLEKAIAQAANGKMPDPPQSMDLKWYQDRNVREYILVVLVALALAGVDLIDLAKQLAAAIGG